MKWCCETFRYAAENRQDDGFVAYAVPPRSPDAEPQFGFAFRAVRTQDIPQLQAAVAGMSGTGNLKLTGAFRLGFCPWCGVRLADYYRTSYQELSDKDLRREFEFA